MALDYDTYVTQIANLLVVRESTDPYFLIMLPGMIDYAEQRMYRELDLLHTQVTDASATASSGNRDFTLPITLGTFIVVDNVNIITPLAAHSSNGARNQLTPVSREFLDMTYPSGQTATGVPEFFAMNGNTEIIFGPAPDAAYDVEVIGTQRPAVLSSGNSSTILTQYVPDVFIAASMVFASGYQRNFGSQGDDPKMSVSWEGQYQTLMQSAAVEQAKAKFSSIATSASKA